MINDQTRELSLILAASHALAWETGNPTASVFDDPGRERWKRRIEAAEDLEAACRESLIVLHRLANGDYSTLTDAQEQFEDDACGACASIETALARIDNPPTVGTRGDRP